MAQDFDFELLAELDEPTAGGTLTSFTNFGRCWIDNVQVSSWNNDTKSFDKREYKGEQLKAGETIEFQLHQDLKEFNPALEFDKTWYIQKKASGARAKDKTLWGEITKPSIVAVFGSEKDFYKAMTNRRYCAIEDHVTGQTRKSKKDGKTYDITAPKFIAVYKNKSECEKAREQMYAKKESTTSGIPDEVIGQVVALLKAVPADQLPGMLKATAPFNAYDVDQLIATAKSRPPF